MNRGHEIETRHLVALRAVADEGSFAGAADVLGFSQAAISQQIAGLERVLGQVMFDRPGGPRPATITPAGRVVLRHARQVLDRLDSIDNDLRHLQAGTGGRVVCGTFQSITVRLLPDLVTAMRVTMPDVALQLFETEEVDELLEGLLSGDIDVAFFANPPDDPRYDMVPLGTDPYVALTPAEGKRRSTPLPVRELVGVPMIGQKESVYQTEIDEGLRSLGVTPRYVFRTNDNGGVQAMVRAGLGLAVMPLLAVDTADPGVAVRPLDPPIRPRLLCVGLRAEGARLPAAERLVQLVRRTSRPHLTRVNTPE